MQRGEFKKLMRDDGGQKVGCENRNEQAQIPERDVRRCCGCKFCITRANGTRGVQDNPDNQNSTQLQQTHQQ